MCWETGLPDCGENVWIYPRGRYAFASVSRLENGRYLSKAYYAKGRWSTHDDLDEAIAAAKNHWNTLTAKKSWIEKI